MANVLTQVKLNEDFDNKIIEIKPRIVSLSDNGMMSPEDKIKLDGLDLNANKYTLPVASYNDLGGLKTNYTNNNENIAFLLNSVNKGYFTLTKDAIEKALGYTTNSGSSITSYTLPVATGTTLGGIYIDYLSREDKLKVELSGNDKAFVRLTKEALVYALGYYPENVDNGEYELKPASSMALGGIRLGFLNAGKMVAISTSSNKAYATLTKESIIAALGYTPLNSEEIQLCNIDCTLISNKEYSHDIIKNILLN